MDNAQIVKRIQKKIDKFDKDDFDIDYVKKAIKSLGKINTISACSALIQIFKFNEDDICEEVSMILFNRYKKALKPLIRALQDENISRHAIDLLGECPDKDLLYDELTWAINRVLYDTDDDEFDGYYLFNLINVLRNFPAEQILHNLMEIYNIADVTNDVIIEIFDDIGEDALEGVFYAIENDINSRYDELVRILHQNKNDNTTERLFTYNVNNFFDNRELNEKLYQALMTFEQRANEVILKKANSGDATEQTVALFLLKKNGYLSISNDLLTVPDKERTHDISQQVTV